MKKSGLKLKTWALIFICLLFFTPTVLKVGAFSPALTITAGDKRYVFYYPQIDYGRYGTTLKGQSSVVERICADCDVDPIDAILQFNPNNDNPFTVQAGKFGKKIDKQKLIADIAHALNAGITSVTARFIKCEPKYTKAQLLKQTALRSQFTTQFPYSSPARKHNIALACSLINGCIVEPNECFSFNERVGERSEDRGFLPANIIVNGEFVSGIGGGVCQVSSTLYNAALTAGLTVTESYRHSLLVDYIEPSFDAMVSYGACDLKFKNTTQSPIYISATASSSQLTIKIYGLKREYEYERVWNCLEVIKATTEEVEWAEGLKESLAHDGLISEGFLKIYKNGNLIEIKKLRHDVYAAKNGIKFKSSNQSSQ